MTTRIPKLLHYCFGLSPNFGRKPWSMVHHVCVKSAIEHIKPAHTFLYYEFEPTGPWWALTRPLLNPVRIKAPTHIFGRPVKLVAHKADVVRLEMLMKHGGIYLDTDVIVHRDFDDLVNASFVISQEGDHGLSNAAMLSEPNSPFVQRWHQEYRWFRGDYSWNEHSIKLPLKLAAEMPETVTVLPHTAFCWPLHDNNGLTRLFEANQPSLSGGQRVYGHHLWESSSWTRYLQHLTPGRVRTIESNFHRWLRPYVSGLPDDFGAPSLVDRIESRLQRAAREMRNALNHSSS